MERSGKYRFDTEHQSWPVRKHLGIAAVVSALAIVACDPASSEETAPIVSDRCSNFDTSDNTHVHMASPKGGETFRAGDSLKISICSEDPDLYVLVDMAYSLSFDGRRWISIYPDRSKDGSRASWLIPESITDIDLNTLDEIIVPCVTDNFLVKATRYNHEEDFDVVDSPIHIVPK